jgi:hypothetical protein
MMVSLQQKQFVAGGVEIALAEVPERMRMGVPARISCGLGWARASMLCATYADAKLFAPHVLVYFRRSRCWRVAVLDAGSAGRNAFARSYRGAG